MNTSPIEALMATETIRNMARSLVLHRHERAEFTTQDGHPTYEFISAADEWYFLKSDEVMPGQRLGDIAKAILRIAFPERHAQFDHLIELEQQAEQAHTDYELTGVPIEQRHQQVINCRRAYAALHDAMDQLSASELHEFGTYRLHAVWRVSA